MALAHDATRVLILGDSHVFWAARFVRSAGSSWPGVSMDFAVDGHGCRTPSFIGIRGGKLTTMRDDDLWERISILNPGLVILHLGGNDVDSISSSSPGVGAQLVDFARELLEFGVGHVMICHLVKRAKWRQFSPEEGATRVAAVNAFIQEECMGNNNISVWKHKGLWNPRSRIFMRDGVHFNDLGNFKLYRSFRGALLWAASHRGTGQGGR